MKTITITDEQFEQIKDVVSKVETKQDDKQKKTTIYKIDGSVLYESDKKTIKEAVVEAVYREADLSEADLREADLSEADLWEADLSEANLREANLRGANLSEANLREADLRGANLSEAELCEAKFYGKGGTIKLKPNQVTDFLNALGFQVED
jgi:uncharacterized protein YjbI with pentapeptide repeats